MCRRGALPWRHNGALGWSRGGFHSPTEQCLYIFISLCGYVRVFCVRWGGSSWDTPVFGRCRRHEQHGAHEENGVVLAVMETVSDGTIVGEVYLIWNWILILDEN